MLLKEQLKKDLDNFLADELQLIVRDELKVIMTEYMELEELSKEVRNELQEELLLLVIEEELKYLMKEILQSTTLEVGACDEDDSVPKTIDTDSDRNPPFPLYPDVILNNSHNTYIYQVGKSGEVKSTSSEKEPLVIKNVIGIDKVSSITTPASFRPMTRSTSMKQRPSLSQKAVSIKKENPTRKSKRTEQQTGAKSCTLNDVLDDLTAMSLNQTVPSQKIICIIPPSPKEDNSDIDSGDEEMVDIENLPGMVLENDAEATWEPKIESKSDAKKKYSPDTKWEQNKDIKKGDTLRVKIERKEEFDIRDHILPEDREIDWTPTKVFEMVFEKAFPLIIKETNRYAAQKGDHSFTLDGTSLRACIGVLLASGIVSVSRQRMYWENSRLVGCEMISDNLKRRFFELFKKYVHLADSENLDESRKSARVLEFFKVLKDSCSQHSRFFDKSESNVDETMVEYFGRYGQALKQCILNKPIRFGYKIWSHNLPNGYLLNFNLYEGKDGHKSDLVSAYGLGAGVTMEFIDSSTVTVPHVLAIDNYFNSTKLCVELKKKDVGVVGTVRTDRVGTALKVNEQKVKKEAKAEGKRGSKATTKTGRVGKASTVKVRESKVQREEKSMSKDISPTLKLKERGDMTYTSASDGSVIVVQWLDNGKVTTCSNFIGVSPPNTVKRWNRSNKSYMDIKQPALIAKYNSIMGGSDRMNQNVNLYRTSIRSKTWWWPLFTWGIDAMMSNAWIIYREIQKEINPNLAQCDQVSFRKEVAETYLMSAGEHLHKPGSRHVQPPVSRDIRTDLTGQHLIKVIEKSRRCKKCNSKTNRICNTCEVHLHDKCFLAFHSN